jgi:hypothetical protein
MGVPVRKEPAIEDENPAYLRTACGLAPLGALQSASKVLQDDE